MTYAISDIHGCYAEFLELLKLIHFSEDDELYILGDVVDRGKAPVKLLLDLMARPNVFLLIGNHEYMMCEVLKRALCEVTDELVEQWDNDETELKYTMELVMAWIEDGGGVTLTQLKELPNEQRRDILDYALDAELYADLEINGKRFILAHADFPKQGEGSVSDFCMNRADYSRRYFKNENTFLITGHTPTPVIREDKQPLVFEQNGHIAIDCGCVFGGKLAAYCLDTGESFYIDKLKKVETDELVSDPF